MTLKNEMTDFETRLKELNELERKATVGYYVSPQAEIVGKNHVRDALTSQLIADCVSKYDAQFIAAARNLTREMITKISHLQEELKWTKGVKDILLKANEENQKLRELLGKAREIVGLAAAQVIITPDCAPLSRMAKEVRKEIDDSKLLETE